ncbi:hypothetical protein B0H67DRAFT_108885 [Lasiosphaeris hirsuta]|uniref:Uncharacterized protein n=1 Tax=Lasiosphaeris hirsuta TaxID=260670 RepID=A0AA40E5E7_9PEZI|nr:hypothetical protein B0H67DRAFT_108885 [Lasiosphaeris hirsuta]
MAAIRCPLRLNSTAGRLMFSFNLKGSCHIASSTSGDDMPPIISMKHSIIQLWHLPSLLILPLACHGNVIGTWKQARETGLGPQPPQIPWGKNPAPTAAPGGEVGLHKRQNLLTNCAYVSGVLSDPIRCQYGLICSTAAGHVGCCASTDTACHIATACLDFTAFQQGLCSGKGVSTDCCSNSASQFCNILTYFDLPYQSIIGCGAVQYRAPLFANPTSSGASSRASTSTVTGDDDTEPPTPYPNPYPASTSSDPPIGAIVGGVVGGVIGFALLAALITWLTLRKRDKTKRSDPSQLRGLPTLEQPRQASRLDPRNSILKPVGTTALFATPHSPTSPGFASPLPFSAYSPYGGPPATSGPSADQVSAVSGPGVPQPGDYFQQAGGVPPAAEMSTEPVERVVHELPDRSPDRSPGH